ncbi:similar to Saccharomyces cerevisiae YBR253W SRB6 Subunit of the RNA polymerase II mediator complex [Maudiozyma barnettii]|uniref:Similar to Saccharomyces cerevisiae YBR253W SRB6 Subunit of the RNA polymerase II mediator complex n=1 Tax=Maudiozyma barnettii TaxID=61262 RepID=A0A8H2ZHL2_9SACH|nr:Srb6p [Kazachstania barnettii]CAB4254058.1 similar to Saccharomyces cerevisiae YBR253W SRB6 Subunit of the RNA polymerase II mediator complex [Kazachstania barnettii]CAD1781808.1 similar to Saccharomyces cerevisiae YBR253W SRB6 Subunit of the RNA polymerase II mediator complex [Kazachstania barnettii]
MSNQALFEKLSQTSELLSVKLAQLIRLSSLENVDENDDDSNSPNEGSELGNTLTAETDISVATSGVMLVNSQTMQLVKGVQDLLLLTRNIREKWILNQIPEKSETEVPVINYNELDSLLEKCMGEIIGETDL